MRDPACAAFCSHQNKAAAQHQWLLRPGDCRRRETFYHSLKLLYRCGIRQILGATTLVPAGPLASHVMIRVMARPPDSAPALLIKLRTALGRTLSLGARMLGQKDRGWMTFTAPVRDDAAAISLDGRPRCLQSMINATRPLRAQRRALRPQIKGRENRWRSI